MKSWKKEDSGNDGDKVAECYRNRKEGWHGMLGMSREGLVRACGGGGNVG